MDGKGVDVLFFSSCHRDDKLNVPRPSIFGAQTLEMFSGERLMMLLYFVVVIMMRN